MKINPKIPGIIILVFLILNTGQVSAQALETNSNSATAGIPTVASLPWPPQLPDGKEVATDRSPDFIIKPGHVKLDVGVEIAKTAPTIDFLYFPGQTHPGKLWSVWGDGSSIGSKYYSSMRGPSTSRWDSQV